MFINRRKIEFIGLFTPSLYNRKEMIGVNILNNSNPLDEFRKRNGQELIINLNNKIKACSKCYNNFCHKCYLGN